MPKRFGDEAQKEEIAEADKLEYPQVMELLSSFARRLSNRLENAQRVLENMRENDDPQYVESHALYRKLLWQWQRSRVALLVLRLEHPNYDTRALTTMEGERDEGRSGKT